jgi:hypothetical protein
MARSGVIAALALHPTPTWWTEADQAELDLLCWALVDALFEHRPGCDTCQTGYPSCLTVRAAIQPVIDWRQGRMLVSRAEHLRSGQELIDFGARLGFTAEQVRDLQAKWRTEEREA